MIIYKITNILTKDFYIGKTKRTLHQRFYSHKYDALEKHSQTHFHRAVKKYGYENFLIEKIDEAKNNFELNQKEIYWIQHLSPAYNMTKGGDGGDVSKSPNYIKSQKNKFYQHSIESKEKIRKAHLGKSKPPISEEHKKKISLGNLGKKRPPRTKQWKLKQSISQKRRFHNQ